MSTTDKITIELHSMLQARSMPEKVVQYLVQVLPDLTAQELSIMAATSRRPFWHSSMAEEFRTPTTWVGRQIDLVPVLFRVEMTDADPTAVIAAATQTLNNLPLDRRSKKAARRAAGIYKNARWFNKRRRLLATIQRKKLKLSEQSELYLFTRISKAALSVEIPYEMFAADLNTAALITYLAAKMNRRSVFTNKPQDRAYDVIADILLRRCERSATTQWFALAHILPDAKVLSHLTDEEKGWLLGRWTTVLVRMADWLERIWSVTQFDREKMIVARGNDSSTWNTIAGAWNRAREHWVSLTYAISGESILDVVCPGKVMRLMAADVARWHLASGGNVHPDTKVWALLPPPWETLSGRARCGLADIKIACDICKAEFKTWTFRESREAVPFKATPELVHGVEVSSPELATLLRRAGVFSGKGLKGEVPEFEVVRDIHGAATYASGSSNRAVGSAYRQDEE